MDAPNSPLLYSSTVFCSVSLAVYSVGLYLYSIKYKPVRRLDKYIGIGGVGKPVRKEGKAFDGSQQRIAKIRNLLQTIGRMLEIKRYSREIELELLRADIPLRCHEFAGSLFLAIVTLSVLTMSISHNYLLAIGAGLIGALLPVALVKVRKARRISRFNLQICDALGIMSNSLRAGYSFLQSMDLCSTELERPLSVEFGRAIKEIGLGATVDEALANMLKRVPSSDLDIVVTAVLIQRQVGGNLAEITDNISHTIRERSKIQGDIKALTAQGRLSGLIITALPFALAGFLFSINRDYMMPLLVTPLGKVMIGISMVGEILGAIVISNITRIEV